MPLTAFSLGPQITFRFPSFDQFGLSESQCPCFQPQRILPRLDKCSPIFAFTPELHGAPGPSIFACSRSLSIALAPLYSRPWFILSSLLGRVSPPSTHLVGVPRSSLPLPGLIPSDFYGPPHVPALVPFLTPWTDPAKLIRCLPLYCPCRCSGCSWAPFFWLTPIPPLFSVHHTQCSDSFHSS